MIIKEVSNLLILKMKLFTPNKNRGSWYFDNNKYGYDYENVPYPEIITDLKVLLNELVTSKMLIPKKLEGREEELVYNNVDELINLIIKDNYLKDCLEFSITGDTVIYTEHGEKVHSEIFSLVAFRTFQQSFMFSTYCDIWLPMAFDEDSFSFTWNLERHNLNYERLPALLKKINSNLFWGNENLLVKEFNERGSMQSGYDLFLTSEVIINEYDRNPNKKFDLNDYLLKINESLK